MKENCKQFHAENGEILKGFKGTTTEVILGEN